MKLVLCIFCCILGSGCITRNVWKDNDPNGYIIVPKEIFDKEMAGKIDVPYYQLEPNSVYVQRSGLTKFKAYAVRTITTPFTITIDAISICVIGSIYVAGGSAMIIGSNPEAVMGIGNGIMRSK